MNQANNNGKETNIRSEVISTGKHSLIYVTGTALSRAIGFFMIPVYTRFIAPSGYGAMELIEIIISIMTIIMSLGISEGFSRFYYCEKSVDARNRVASTVFLGLGLIGLPIVIIFLIFSNPVAFILLDSIDYAHHLKVAIIASWFTMICEVGFSYLRMLYKAKTFVIVTTLQLFIALSLNIWFIVYCGLGILGIFYSTMISQGIIGLSLSISILCKIKFRFSGHLLRDVGFFGIPLIPSRIGVLVGFMSNRLFLRWMLTADTTVALTQIGLFSLGHKFGVIINRLFNAPFNSFWTPRRMELLLSKDPSSIQTVSRICTYAISFLVYFALLISCGVKSLIMIMAPPEYLGAHVVVPFVALSYVFLGLETHFSAGILYQKKTKWASYITFLSVPIVLLWNYLFIPKWGLVAAATSNLAGGTVRVVILYFVSQRFYYIPYELNRILKVFAASFLIYFFTQALSFYSPWASLFVRIAIALMLPLVLVLFRFYHAGEIEFARSILSRGINLIFLRENKSER